jgi:photoactive yellow protein
MTLPDFHDSQLAHKVEQLSAAQIDELPFGVIRLDAGGVVTVFNKTEAVESGYNSRPSLGLDFFLEVAPCMGQPEFRGRIEQARQRGQVDIEFGWVGDFSDINRAMQVRIQSANDGGLWIFNLRDLN